MTGKTLSHKLKSQFIPELDAVYLVNYSAKASCRHNCLFYKPIMVLLRQSDYAYPDTLISSSFSSNAQELIELFAKSLGHAYTRQTNAWPPLHAMS